MSTPFEIPEKSPWYARPWGVIVIALGLILMIFVLYVGLRTFSYWRQIRLGGIPAEIQGQLTRGRINPPARLQEHLAYADENDPVFGNPNAPLQIVEFADFECPFSRDESLIIREIMARFPDKIHYIYRDFPLDEIHPHAFRAAEGANCAQDQGKFWAMHDKLYQNSLKLTDLDLKLYAIEVGLDIAQFNDCFDNEKYRDEIEIDRADGIAAGVIGTPTFFINGHKVEGAIPMKIWEQIIEKTL